MTLENINHIADVAYYCIWIVGMVIAIDTFRLGHKLRKIKNED